MKDVADGILNPKEQSSWLLRGDRNGIPDAPVGVHDIAKHVSGSKTISRLGVRQRSDSVFNKREPRFQEEGKRLVLGDGENVGSQVQFP
ncbi:MAG: hypothetical protein U0Q11_11575 [Vicinamibacterales bacterium]